MPSRAPQEELPAFDPIVLTRIMEYVASRAQPLIRQYFEKHTGQKLAPLPEDPLNIQEAYTDFTRALMKNPRRLIALNFDYWNKLSQITENTAKRLQGETIQDIFAPPITDKRFASDIWTDNPLFDHIKQTYLMTCDWLIQAANETEDLPTDTRDRILFALRQYADALSPTNFILTNPDVLKETLESHGDNLIRGLENMLADMERGAGELAISTTDFKAFTIGDNLAATEGAVIFENEMMQLIQYAPSTDKAFKTPLLIIPPCINKYYILDLQPKNSLVKWLVDQGHTVFLISWTNPDTDQKNLSFDDYVTQGVFEALTQIETVTKEETVNAIGYCIGGTLLSCALSLLQTQGQSKRIQSATFLTTLIDFSDPGELGLFTRPAALDAMEKEIAKTGIFEGSRLKRTFFALRANDLIWSFVVNNYLLGKEPFPFDILYWNDDSTNLSGKMFLWYLRQMYQYNNLIKPDGLSIDGTPVNIQKIKTPSYFLSTREDHIAPWRTTYVGYNALGGPKEFVLAASGHVAGIVNPPAKNKYCYWTSSSKSKDPQVWVDKAKEHEGSWWPHWQAWVTPYTGPKVKSRTIKKSLEKAPGSYVRT